MKDLRMLGEFSGPTEAREWFYAFLDKAQRNGFNNALHNEARNGLLALKWFLEDLVE